MKPHKYKAKPKEQDLIKPCLELLHYRRCLAWRMNVGKAKFDDRHVAFGVRGMSVIIGVLPDGRFLAVELKLPGRAAAVTPYQAAFIGAVKQQGGFACVVTSLDELEAAMTKALSENRT